MVSSVRKIINDFKPSNVLVVWDGEGEKPARLAETVFWVPQVEDSTNLAEKFALITEHWRPKVVGELNGQEVKLTAREFDLLWFLASHPRRVFSRDQLMASVWGYTAALDTGTVTVHVRRLREKVEDDPSEPKYLETVWGIGYRLAA